MTDMTRSVWVDDPPPDRTVPRWSEEDGRHVNDDLQTHFQDDAVATDVETFTDAGDLGVQYSRHNSKQVAANSTGGLFTIRVPDVTCIINVTVKVTTCTATTPVGGELHYKASFKNSPGGGLVAYVAAKDVTDPDFRDANTTVSLSFSIASDTEIDVIAKTNDGGSGPKTNFIATCFIQLVQSTGL